MSIVRLNGKLAALGKAQQCKLQSLKTHKIYSNVEA